MSARWFQVVDRHGLPLSDRFTLIGAVRQYRAIARQTRGSQARFPGVRLVEQAACGPKQVLPRVEYVVRGDGSDYRAWLAGVLGGMGLGS